jgi:hypothetical protein
MLKGETKSVNCGHQSANCSSPRRYKHGNPWCNYIDRVKLLIRPPKLSVKPTSSHLIARLEELQKEIIYFALLNISFIFRRILQHSVKFYDMGPTAILPLWRKACCGFLSPLKINLPQPGLNSRTISPMASTLTITPPRTTRILGAGDQTDSVQWWYYQQKTS